ncbi:MAG: hypothetical protein ACTSSJ_05530 [Candidatus Odinarchaeia archaeon]
MSKAYWERTPLRNAVLNCIIKRQGVVLDDELFTMLKKDFEDLSYSVLNKILMSLETQGMIHVSQITKTKRRVEIIKKGEEFLAVGED